MFFESHMLHTFNLFTPFNLFTIRTPIQTALYDTSDTKVLVIA